MFSATDAKNFIESYSGEKRARISFQWNGKHAEELRDSNQELRNAVIDAIANHGAAASTELLGHLLEEETSFSVEAWGAIDELSSLAEKFLAQGRTESVLTFIRCKWKSFDTDMACAGMRISEPLRQELEQFCRSQAKSAGQHNVLYEQGAAYFASLARNVTAP